MPAAFAQSTEPFVIEGKDGLRLLNDRPLNAETPPHLLDDEVTPTARLFVRNNGSVPEMATKQDATHWQLQSARRRAVLHSLDMQDGIG